ncbi:MAG: hypothetical protein WKG07_11625 [Hymenobacter sp.]
METTFGNTGRNNNSCTFNPNHPIMEKTEVQHQVHLDGAIHLLTGDLTEEASRAGLDNQFQRWIEDLKDANNPAFHQLVVDMQALKAHFGSGTTRRERYCYLLLARLGHTTPLRPPTFAEGNTAPRVTKLGEVLSGRSSAAARQLCWCPMGSCPRIFRRT